jgi:hypothetical protein
MSPMGQAVTFLTPLRSVWHNLLPLLMLSSLYPAFATMSF